MRYYTVACVISNFPAISHAESVDPYNISRISLLTGSDNALKVSANAKDIPPDPIGC